MRDILELLRAGMPVQVLHMLRWSALVSALLSGLGAFAQARPIAVSAGGRIDSTVCAACHPHEAQAYAQTGMGRSFFRPGIRNTIENYAQSEFYHSLSGTHYAMVMRNGEYFQRRWQLGYDGKETNVEELSVDYVAGSGNHARAYLHRTQRGTLIQLPLGWYSETGGHWGMSPGFDSPHPQTRRLMSYECVFCHNAYPALPVSHEHIGSEPVFTGSLPQGIDCQRCHGPGEKHLRSVQTPGASRESIRASIVNPARLSSNLQMDVCMQCHLEPTSTALPSIIRRFERGPFSYQAGQPLTDFALYFDHAPGTGHEDKFEIAGSAYRLRKSRCYLESRGALTCETCHDPHHMARGEEAEKRYSAVCLGCHAAPLEALVSSGKHRAEAGCVSCHMPKRRTEDVVHVVMTDHLIQRLPPARDLLAELPERHPKESEEYRGEVIPYYPSQLSASGDQALYRAAAQVMLNNNLQKGLPLLAQEIAVQKPKTAGFYIVLGAALARSAEPGKAAPAYEKAIEIAPDSLTSSLFALVNALKASGQKERVPNLLTRAMRLDPSDGRPWYEAAALDEEQSRTAEAVSEMQKAVALAPDLSGAYTNLGSLLSKLGQSGPAENSLREALRIDPYDATAYDLLGRVLAGKDQLTEALFDFREATRLRPGFEPHIYDYALALVRLNRFDEAEASARAATKADSKQAEAHELLAGLLARKRQLHEAAYEYTQVLKLRPDSVRTQLELASVLAAAGDLPAAVLHLREAAKSNDPAMAQQAARALQQLKAQ